MQTQYQDENMAHLRTWRSSVIQMFEMYFDQMENEYKERVMSIHMESMLKLEVVQLEIDKVP
jgi:hypothetical protein